MGRGAEPAGAVESVKHLEEVGHKYAYVHLFCSHIVNATPMME